MIIKNLKKIAFIKYGGFASGGTEVSFQTLAKHLSETYEVDYYYCDPTPYIGSDYTHPPTDVFRKEYLTNSKVNIIKFNVEFKDLTVRTHNWVNTNFWELFSENKYSLILSTTAGPPEYPFVEITETPIINILTLNAGVSNQENICKTVLISEFSQKQWVRDGGIEAKSIVIPLVREGIPKLEDDFRKELSLKNKFIFGFHQREADDIFSNIPLKSYQKIEREDNFFLMLGGSVLYQKQAEELKLKNFLRLDSSSDMEILNKFLNTLDVYTHGRKYGETFGLVLTEAMSYGIPLISHRAESNAQEEVIGEAGRVFNKSNTFSYSKEMKKLQNHPTYYEEISKKSYSRFLKYYSSEAILEKYSKLIQEFI